MNHKPAAKLASLHLRIVSMMIYLTILRISRGFSIFWAVRFSTRWSTGSYILANSSRSLAFTWCTGDTPAIGEILQTRCDRNVPIFSSGSTGEIRSPRAFSFRAPCENRGVAILAPRRNRDGTTLRFGRSRDKRLPIVVTKSVPLPRAWTRRTSRNTCQGHNWSTCGVRSQRAAGALAWSSELVNSRLARDSCARSHEEKRKGALSRRTCRTRIGIDSTINNFVNRVRL